MKTKRIVLGVTGSIAAYKAAELIRILLEKKMRVSVIMTECAEKFITPLTLATLSGECVYKEMFGKSRAYTNMPHIDLAKDADVLLIAPATANIIGKMASGIADDLLSAVALATKAPILVAPAMNNNMYSNKIVQENCTKLKKHGIKMIAPGKGKLACGDEGVGRLADVEKIVDAVMKAV